MSDFLVLKGVKAAGEALLSESLRVGLVEFFKWAFLEIGGFDPVRLSASGAFGGDPSRLRPSSDPNFAPGTCWEGLRKDWVWETGVFQGRSTFRVSGVWLDTGFLPLASGVAVDYPNGRVVLANPASGVVRCEHVDRRYSVTGESDLWREIQQDSYRADDPNFLRPGSGAWSGSAENRLQLPAVVVNPVPRTSRVGLALGGGDVVRQEVVFGVVAETTWDRDYLHDAISYQWQKRVQGMDLQRLRDDGALPLDWGGSPASGAMQYPQLIAPTGQGGYFWRQIRLMEVQSAPLHLVPPLEGALVRVMAEVDLP